MRATVIIPTYDHGPLLLSAVRCVQRQSFQDFELFIIGDGVTKETREAVEQALSLDSRIRFFDQPKSPRTGEPYRHLALKEASGDIVCYLSDDDLWLSNHLETFSRALTRYDVVHSLCCWIKPDGQISARLVDWAVPEWVNWTLSGQSLGGLSFVGHTMEFYRLLPYGWRTTPVDRPTDQYMWEQFFSMPGVRAGCTGWPSVIRFSAIPRQNWTLERRQEELRAWEQKISASRPEDLLEEVGHCLALSFYRLNRQVERLRRENERLQEGQHGLARK